MLKPIQILFISLIFFCSCSSLKKSTNRNNIINLSYQNKEQANGQYITHPIKDSYGKTGNLSWNIFDHAYNKVITNDIIDLKIIDNERIKVSHYSGNLLVKSKIFKGKFKNGYFQFKRKYLIIPGLYINLYRNRIFRIGLLENGNIITDYNQISMGSVFFILPFYENEKEFSIEFESLQNIQQQIPNWEK